MHQPVINIPALAFDLWCDREGCRKGVSASDVWDWAVLKGDVWQAHGQAVATLPDTSLGPLIGRPGTRQRSCRAATRLGNS
jgi:hypothetical protein